MSLYGKRMLRKPGGFGFLSKKVAMPQTDAQKTSERTDPVAAPVALGP